MQQISFLYVRDLAVTFLSFYDCTFSVSITLSLKRRPETIHLLKACVLYFLSNFYFSPNDNPSKTVKDVFYFILKALFVLEIFIFLYFCLPFFFSLSVIALEADRR